MLRRLGCLAMLLAGGCGPQYTAMSVGRPADPRPRGCEVTEERLTPKEAEDRFRQVGVICWSGGDGKRFNDLACRLGGDVVVRTGFCANGQGRGATGGVEYGVYASSL